MIQKGGRNLIRIAVVDDEKECLDRISGYLEIMKEYPIECFFTSSAEGLLEKLREGDAFDIVFLDIEMDSMTGIEAAKCICKDFGSTLIIFTTAYKQYVKEAFYVNAFQYMFKPIEYRDFRYELERAIRTIKLRNQTFEISYGHEKILLKCSDILYIETKNRHLAVKTAGKEYLYNGALKEAERQLSKYGFSKAEQGILVNLCHVRRVDTKRIEFDNEDIRYISRRFYKSFLSDLNLYLSGV